MVTSDFIPEVEIQLFRTCAMTNTQYNPYLWPSLTSLVQWWKPWVILFLARQCTTCT